VNQQHVQNIEHIQSELEMLLDLNMIAKNIKFLEEKAQEKIFATFS
jgi:hypothetical protein